MINKKFEYEADILSSDQLKELYILLDRNEFTAAIQAGGKFLYAVKYSFQEGNAMEMAAAIQDFLNQNRSYTQGKFFIYPDFVNIIPDMDFAEVHDWYMGVAKETLTYLYHRHSALDIVEVNCVDKDLLNATRELFPGVEFWPLLSQYRPYWGLEEKAVFVNFRNENQVIIGLKDGQQLLSYAAFEVQNNDDVFYHLVNVIQKNNLNTIEVDVYLGAQHLGLRNKLRDYFNEVKVFKGGNELTALSTEVAMPDFWFLV